MNIILASASPRRQELLTKIVADFEVIPADIDEEQDQHFSPEEYVLAMAERKAQRVYKEHPNALVIGCDTIVTLEGKLFQKPRDRQEACQMLSALSGKTHTVYTSVVLMGNQKILQDTIATHVTFFELKDEEIEQYLAENEYQDKAGAYGIQGQGALLVEKIQGDYYTVVGFPVAYVSRMLEEITRDS